MGNELEFLLREAIISNSIDSVITLINNGADPNKTIFDELNDEDIESGFDLMIRLKRYSMLTLMFERFDFKVSPKCLTYQSLDEKMFQILLRYEATPTRAKILSSNTSIGLFTLIPVLGYDSDLHSEMLINTYSIGSRLLELSRDSDQSEFRDDYQKLLSIGFHTISEKDAIYVLRYLRSHSPLPLSRNKIELIKGSATEIKNTRMKIIKERLFEICVALQELELPTLILIEIMDQIFPYAILIPMFKKWNMICVVRHPTFRK